MDAQCHCYQVARISLLVKQVSWYKSNKKRYDFRSGPVHSKKEGKEEDPRKCQDGHTGAGLNLRLLRSEAETCGGTFLGCSLEEQMSNRTLVGHLQVLNGEFPLWRKVHVIPKDICKMDMKSLLILKIYLCNWVQRSWSNYSKSFKLATSEWL